MQQWALWCNPHLYLYPYFYVYAHVYATQDKYGRKDSLGLLLGEHYKNCNFLWPFFCWRKSSILGVFVWKEKKKMKKKHSEAGSYQEECWSMLGETERVFSYSLWSVILFYFFPFRSHLQGQEGKTLWIRVCPSQGKHMRPQKQLTQQCICLWN